MGHRKIAQERSGQMSPDEHAQIAEQLQQMGAHEHAKYHQKVVDDHAAKQAEMDELLGAVEQVGQDVEQGAKDRKEGVAAQVREGLENQKAKIAADEKAAEPARDAAANMGAEIEDKKAKAEADPYQQALQDHEAHKQEVDQTHADAMKEHADMTREFEQHTKKTTKLQEKVRQHQKKDPGTFGKKVSDFADPADFTKEKNKHLQAKKKHQEQMKKLKEELGDHKANKPEKPGKPPKHPGYDKEPDPEEFGGKVPETAQEKAAHKDHTGRAQSLSDNIASHLEGNPEMSDSDRAKLEQVQEALKEHTGHEKTPTKDHTKNLKELEKMAGAHGKEAFQEEGVEEVAPPETPMDELRAETHKDNARKLHETLQQHIDKMEADGDAEGAQRLRKIQEQAQTHIDNDMMPGSEEEAHLKELHKMAGDHAKPPKEEAGGGEAVQKEPAAKKPRRERGVDWASAFGRGSAIGTKLGHAAGSAEGAGAIASTALNVGAGGVAQAGEDLLHKPHRRAAEKRAEEEATKEREAKKEAPVEKGLYLDLESGLDLLKAVQVPNTSVSADSGKQAKRRMETSYSEQPVGVMGQSGIAMHDDPDVGREWKHGDDEDEEETNKSGSDILKSLMADVEPVVSRHRYNPREVEYLRDVLGYDEAAISKGLVKISGRERAAFQDWMQERLQKSMATLVGGLSG